MKIAIFSDSHANIFAFEAMIKRAQQIGVESFLNLGDMVGYYMQPKAVVEKAKSLPGWAIQGNHERLLRSITNREIKLADVTKTYGQGHQRALLDLTAEQFEWLISLPTERDVAVDGLNIKMCHGAPGAPDRYVYPDTSKQDLRDLCDDNFDYIFSGHTHYPFIFQSGNCTFVNVGSLGQSKDVGGLATWGILDTSNSVFSQIHTPYDLLPLVNEIRKESNTNEEYLISVLGRNRYDINNIHFNS